MAASTQMCSILTVVIIIQHILLNAAWKDLDPLSRILQDAGIKAAHPAFGFIYSAAVDEALASALLSTPASCTTSNPFRYSYCL